MSQLTYSVVTVTLEDREDGGLRVYSDDLPGLILSGEDREKVASRIVPAIRALFEYKGFQAVVVHPAQPVAEVLKSASPRDMDMHVQHGQFVVELLRPAA